MSKSEKKINIDYVAQLARLELSDDDKAKLSGQLNDILVYFEKLNSVNVDGICLLYTSPSPRDKRQSRMPSSA